MRNIIVIFLCLISLESKAQTRSSTPDKPKLIVGLMVDQMRWDFLYKYRSRYTTGGFKRLTDKGFTFDNAFIPYTPTYTGVGHSCVYTGSVPALTGIVGNNWYDRSTGKNMYCASDSTVQGVGSTGAEGKMSPRNMWASTITDELRMSNNFQSKVIGIALKDRGSILPAGHAANAAYWLDEGTWITSTFYMNQLPAWVQAYNKLDKGGNLMKQDWNTLFPIDTYTLSTKDSAEYEAPIRGLKTTTFPHALSTLTTTKYDALRTSPAGNTFTLDFAKAAIENEKLGSGKFTDFLAISLSTPDYIGHNFGPNSIEIEDCYLRLDRDIDQFLKYLDAKLGVGNYLVFLTADHGVSHVAQYLVENKMPGGTFSQSLIMRSLNKNIDSIFGIKNAVLSVMNYQVYLNHSLFTGKDAEKSAVLNDIRRQLLSNPQVTQVINLSQLGSEPVPSPLKEMIINGYSPLRSGDLQFVVKPGIYDGGTKGTTHGMWNPYDSHIPLVFFGWNVRPGRNTDNVHMTDIAPTLASMLRIQMPNACIGQSLESKMK